MNESRTPEQIAANLERFANERVDGSVDEWQEFYSDLRQAAALLRSSPPPPWRETIRAEIAGVVNAIEKGVLTGDSAVDAVLARLAAHDHTAGFQPCLACGGALVMNPLPCPDGKPGCTAAHYGQPYCPTCQPSRLAAQPVDESGWVIVRDVPGGLAYFAGLETFTLNNLQALRFARRADAELMMALLHAGSPHPDRVEEHLWCASPPCAAQPETPSAHPHRIISTDEGTGLQRERVRPAPTDDRAQLQRWRGLLVPSTNALRDVERIGWGTQGVEPKRWAEQVREPLLKLLAELDAALASPPPKENP